MPVNNTRYDYSAITQRPGFRWPNGERLAVWVCVNVEHFRVDVPSTSQSGGLAHLKPDVINYAWRDYGLRVGIWRIFEIMERVGLKGSATLNAEVCLHEAPVVHEMVRLGWSILGHGMTNSQLLTDLSETEERQVINETLDTIQRTTGTRPIGWLGPALAESFKTPELLVEAGVKYVCDWTSDDQPFPIKVDNGKLASVPYTQHLNDIGMILEAKRSDQEFFQQICDQFDVLYREGVAIPRTMAIALHPFLVGIPHRSKYLEQALAYIASHKDVWFCTGDDIYNWYASEYGG
ncbi:MAG: polysaccharide deacetylase family protein [Chloroflexi bacterium]|nr:polysaccharide deacetylase family protein [Chloroflexota bacterium]